MHDPMTVAFEIRRPWRDKPSKFWPDGYRPTMITIWHVDPEVDGSDDSCGYSYPRIPRELGEQAEKIAASEWEFMFGKYPYKYQSPSAYEIIFALWSMIAWRLFKRRRLTLLEMEEIASLAANPSDNLREIVFDATHSPDRAKRLGWLILRCYLRTNRRWYQHPKYHLRHWKIQIHPIQNFKRWAFSKCAGCGRGFKWGYSPTSTSWHGTGPRWFRGEQHIYHSECCKSQAKAA